MIHPSDFENRIGFNRIRELLRNNCLCALGVEAVDRLAFSADSEVIALELSKVREFLDLLRSGESYPDSHYHDPSEIIRLASTEGACAEASDLLRLAQSLGTVLGWLKFLEPRAERYPELHRAALQVRVPRVLMEEVLGKIDDQANVRDNASPDLSRVRKSMHALESRIRKMVGQLLSELSRDGFTPDGALPAFREGRVVIPVRAEFKRRVRGVIIDESATGQTVFMEPEALLELNNEWRDLQLEEKREVIRILSALTAAVRRCIPELEESFRLLQLMDLNRAKARLAMETDAALPVMKSHPVLKWRKARHPLLHLLLKGKRPLIPLDVALETEYRVLLVSGPNAGGKSVCLKTVGLLQYMFQCGLLPSCDPDSEFGVFSSLLLDIGDQQSIENDLSTYSSHLRNMALFVREAGSGTLFLMDELGAGTDPAFGGGIAEAVLNRLVDCGAWGVVTTHYANLKTLAARRRGVINGAMLFDAEHLTPLFRLETGKPGSSYAMELARKSGLSAAVLEEAETIIGERQVSFESLIRSVEEEKAQVERLRTDLEGKEKQLADEVRKFNELNKDLMARKRDIIDRAKQEASDLLRNTNREIEKTIRHIRENKAERKETRKVRGKLEEIKGALTPDADSVAPVSPARKPVVLREGDHVRLIGQDHTGIILSIKEDSAMVQFGLLRSQVKLYRLEPATGGAQEPTAARNSGVDLSSRRMNFKPVGDVRGMRAVEVTPWLESFIDDAVLLGVPEVRILHGKGEGVLRQMVRDYLKGHRSVTSVTDEHADRGGAGISIVRLA